MGIIECRNISKSFGEKVALDGVSLEIPKGRIFGLLGPNGAGKTTLIRIINRITIPNSGEVIFDGRPITQRDVEKIGYLPEERGLYRKMEVGAQAMYLAQLKGMSTRDAQRELKMWFERFGIQDWWKKKIEELSKGMAQKVQFITTVVHKPQLMILDEPFSGFDPVNAELIRQEILRLKEEGATIILSTHNMESVEELCDNIALINKSKTFEEGISNAQELIEGSMSIVILTENGRLIAARDALGRTPIHVGKSDDGFCVSFENFAYQKLGYEDYRELGPGEIVEITSDEVTVLSAPRKKKCICR